MNIGIIGLGLIGGSKALAAKKAYKHCTIWGHDTNKTHLQQAKELGLINHVWDLKSFNILYLLILAFLLIMPLR